MIYKQPPKITVCIPAYNRAHLLGELLDSIVQQSFDDYEILICEDGSPEKDSIRACVDGYIRRYPNRIRYLENEKNLGYDGNIRNLIAQAKGEYCFFMGNDDLMCSDALKYVSEAVEDHPNVGVVLRSYAAFDESPENIIQTFRYFPNERFFPAGEKTVATIYRRSVVIPGMVLHRETALRYASERFDGTLLYQLYLVANILLDKNAVFLPELLALYRNGGVPDFGNAEVEKNNFVPKDQTPASSIHFVKGMLDIVRFVENDRHVSIYRRILQDIGNYSLPIIDVQRGRSLIVFMRYSYDLACLGLWRSPMFYIYFILLLLLGKHRVWAVVHKTKSLLGHTPSIGVFFAGKRG